MEKTRMIEAFLDGSMDSAEKAKFEDSIRKDKTLASEVNLSREINEAIQDEETVKFRQLIQSVIEKQNDKFRKIFKALKYPLAASIIILISFSTWRMLSEKTPQELYVKYYRPYPTEIVTRSASESNSFFDIALRYYSQQNYSTAFSILQKLSTDGVENNASHFYSGLCAIELGMSNYAINELKQIEQESAYNTHALWYLALVYLNTGELMSAREKLEELVLTENMYSIESRKILKKIKI